MFGPPRYLIFPAIVLCCTPCQLLESHFTGVLVGEVTTLEGEVLRCTMEALTLSRYHQTRIPLSVEIDDEGDEPKVCY